MKVAAAVPPRPRLIQHDPCFRCNLAHEPADRLEKALPAVRRQKRCGRFLQHDDIPGAALKCGCNIGAMRKACELGAAASKSFDPGRPFKRLQAPLNPRGHIVHKQVRIADEQHVEAGGLIRRRRISRRTRTGGKCRSMLWQTQSNARNRAVLFICRQSDVSCEPLDQRCNLSRPTPRRLTSLTQFDAIRLHTF